MKISHLTFTHPSRNVTTIKAVVKNASLELGCVIIYSLIKHLLSNNPHTILSARSVMISNSYLSGWRDTPLGNNQKPFISSVPPPLSVKDPCNMSDKSSSSHLPFIIYKCPNNLKWCTLPQRCSMTKDFLVVEELYIVFRIYFLSNSKALAGYHCSLI